MYRQPASIKNYDAVQTAIHWAGWLSVIQSLLWMALTITGILAYCCKIPVTDFLSYGTVVKTVLFDLYFHGSCQMPVGDYQSYNSTMLSIVSTVLNPEQILIWDCVYLGVAFFWLIASVLLLTYVSKTDIKRTLAVIYTWLFFILAICAMDVALGVIFGVDYSRFASKAFGFNLNSLNAGDIDPNAAQLVAATVASMSMMIISFKGFVLWIINFGLFIYLLVIAIRIGNDKDGSDTLFMPRKDSNDILATRPPIRAYEEEKVEVQTYNNGAFVPDTQSVETIEVNEQAMLRAARMSRDANLMDHRFRNIDAFQQYPAPAQNSNRYSPTQETIVVASAGYPQADYSPQLSPNGVGRQYKY